MRTLLQQLDSWQVEYHDESHVRRVMRELSVHLLRPGQRFVWLDANNHIVRELRVLRNGRVFCKPATLKNIRVNPILCVELGLRKTKLAEEPDK